MTLVKTPKTGQYSAVIQTDHGKRRIRTGTTDRKEAARIVKDAKVDDLEQAAKIHRLTGQTMQQIVAGKKVTITQAVAEWVEWLENYGQSARTVDNNSTLFGAWIRDSHLAEKLPSDITERMVDAWVNAPDGTSLGTRKMRLAIIRSFFQYCCAKAYASGNPSKLVRVKMNQLTHQQKEPRAVQSLTVEELGRLTAATTGFWHVCIAIAQWTGLRLGDICQLEWESLSVPNRLIVWTDKRDRRVSLPLTLAEFEKDMKERKHPVNEPMRDHYSKMEAEFTPLLRSLIPVNKVYLFPDQREIATNPKRRSNLSVQFSRLCQASHIEGKSFHGIRHGFCQSMDALQIPIEHIARQVGHASPHTTRGYIE